MDFVLDEHQIHFKERLSRWDAEKIVLAVRTFAPKEKVVLVLACGAVETHFSLGQVGDDGKSLGPYQVQHRYHKNVSRLMLQWDITTNTREAVKHLKQSEWDAQIYNAGFKGKKRGKGKGHLRKVLKAKERIENGYCD